MAAIPGKVLPSMASSRAPPPVDTYETLSANPNLFTQATESPPPTRENAPFLVASTMASATAREPDVKLSNSNTPVGPFHRIVFDFLITSANRASDLGPMSIPSQPSGILSTSQKSVLASFEKSSGVFWY